jgi:hypothetical protein
MDLSSLKLAATFPALDYVWQKVVWGLIVRRIKNERHANHCNNGGPNGSRTLCLISALAIQRYPCGNPPGPVPPQNHLPRSHVVIIPGVSRNVKHNLPESAVFLPPFPPSVRPASRLLAGSASSIRIDARNLGITEPRSLRIYRPSTRRSVRMAPLLALRRYPAMQAECQDIFDHCSAIAPAMPW